MTKNLYVIVGPSGAGKTYIANALRELFGLRQVVSYTNRPKRPLLEDGHIFVSTEELESLKPLINHTMYNGYEYGTTNEIINTSALYVMDVPGVKYMRTEYPGDRPIRVIGITAPHEIRELRMRHRGDTAEVVAARLAEDDAMFADFASICDIVICNSHHNFAAIYDTLMYIHKEEGFKPAPLIDAWFDKRYSEVHLVPGETSEPFRSRCKLALSRDLRYTCELRRVRYEGLLTPWCFTAFEAAQLAIELGIPPSGVCRLMDTADFVPQYLFPAEFPLDILLQKNERGLYCRLNLRPDLVGHTSGKLYFPDRECANSLVEGPAVITEVVDKGSYGFFKATQKQFKAPSEEQLATAIMDNNLEYCTLEVYDGAFGSFAYIPERGVSIVINSAGDVTLDWDILPICRREQDLKEVIPARDFLCQGYHGCSTEELLDKFQQFNFRITDVNVTSSLTYVSEVFDDAQTLGFLKLLRWGNIDYVVIHASVLTKVISSFSTDEIEQLAAEVQQINIEANAAVQNALKKGKLILGKGVVRE